MSDRYAQIANAPVVGTFVKTAGLPVPVELERHSPGDPLIRGRVLLGAAPGGRLAGPVARVLARPGAETATELRDDLRGAAADAGLDAGVWNPETAPEDQSFKALVFDATGIAATADLRELRAFFGPTIRRVERSGRVVVLGTPPGDCAAPGEAIAQRALEGFARSVAKEVRRGATGQLVLVEPGAEDAIESTLRFLLSPRSAYVSGQVVRVGRADSAAPADWERPHEGRVALVTGASRGIGAAIAATLARDGAHVVGLDVPAAADALEEVAAAVSGSTLALDVTDPEAPRTIASHLAREHGGADVIVHNAGITRDKTLGRMDEERWESVIGVNLTAPERITAALLEHEGALKNAARIVCVSSISGIAGNAGQTNYATSKAGVIGLVETLAPTAGERGATVNAVAPGFIETEMTARMPLATREVGRRMNSLSQGGLPADVAETIGWLASPASGGVNGNVIRVCGQSLLGA
jgi:3-oxoacyl-[acyl-carrier protein] reductase